MRVAFLGRPLALGAASGGVFWVGYQIYNADCFEWLTLREAASVEAIVTDPPFGVREFEALDLGKKRAGRGGNWRIPPAMGGSVRQPLPRFSTVTPTEIAGLEAFFERFGRLCLRVLVPGGHLIIANTPLLSDVMYAGLRNAGLDKRGELVRIVKTIRGGDRPRFAEAEFPDVSAMPRGHWEPWGVFRAPLARGETVAHSLRTRGVGALRRPSRDVPFSDVIPRPGPRRKSGPSPTTRA